MQYVVYRIKNLINKRAYYGSTKDWKQRKSIHIAGLQNHNHGNWKLQRDWCNYKPEDFEFKVLFTFDTLAEMLDCEQKYLNKYCGKKSCYNIKDNVFESKAKGKKWSLEQRKKIIQSKIGRKLNFTTEQRLKKKHNAYLRGLVNEYNGKLRRDDIYIYIVNDELDKVYEDYGIDKCANFLNVNINSVIDLIRGNINILCGWRLIHTISLEKYHFVNKDGQELCSYHLSEILDILNLSMDIYASAFRRVWQGEREQCKGWYKYF